jgi:hypothetical protein
MTPESGEFERRRTGREVERERERDLHHGWHFHSNLHELSLIIIGQLFRM